ncbi:hypothetical protein JOC34_003567 [Virgibacillus halotolerans]|nr:hypothetical protein [Virgibacillus halotolerans]
MNKIKNMTSRVAAYVMLQFIKKQRAVNVYNSS